MGVFDRNRCRRLLYISLHVFCIGMLVLPLLSVSGQMLSVSGQIVFTSKVNACNILDPNNSSQLCVCSNVTVTCVFSTRTLKEIPNAIIESVEILNLTRNSIKEIQESDFFKLEQLRTIDLEDNLVRSIDKKAFRNLYRLERLNLDGNLLERLDPSGQTFQHLSSLLLLSLQNNEITSINQYSFLTTISNNKTFIVRLNGNPIHCDCNVWALWFWERSLSRNRIEIQNLICDNDPSKRSYKKVEASVYGPCSDIVNVSSAPDKMCSSCQNEKTNHGCKLRGNQRCPNNETMCKKSITWSEADKDMSIKSECSSYESCLSSETNNQDTCGIGYQTNKNVACQFCCWNPTCSQDSIGGRTKDYTFKLTFVLSNATYQSNLANSFNNDLAVWITGAINSIKGGVDVHFIRVLPEQNKQYRFFFQLEITTLNTETAVAANLKRDIQAIMSYLFPAVPVYLQLSSVPSAECPESVSNYTDMEQIIWTVSPQGVNYMPCPKSSLSSGLSSVSRECIKEDNGFLYWGPEDYSACNGEENLTIDEILNMTISTENAQAVSNRLESYTENLNNLTVDSMNQVVKLLEDFMNETMLAEPGVVENIVGSLSNLINADQQIFQDNTISERFLAIIDDISEKAPLVNGRLIVSTPNLVIAAQGVNASETRDVELIANSDSERNDSKIDVDFSDGNVSQLTARTSVVIPTQAIIAVMTPQEKSNFSRVTFAVHKSDTLFIRMRNGYEKSERNTSENYTCEKNNSSDCQRKHSQITSKINSRVISANIPGVVIKKLKKNITLSFTHNDDNATNLKCVFWDENLFNGTGDWSNEGCSIVRSSSEGTICTCNHLTNFALLFNLYGEPVPDKHQEILSIISFIGCGISVLALLLTLLTYSIFRSRRQSSSSFEIKNSGKNVTELKLRRDNPSKILINLCLALLFSNLIFLIGMQDYTFVNTAACKAVAVLQHYFLLSSLTWMAVEAFYMYLALILVFKTYFTHFILKCSLVGWGVPLLIVVLTLGINATENYGKLDSGLCWLKNDAFFAAFVGPVCLILLINCLAFVLVIRQLISMSSIQVNKKEKNSTIQRLRGAVGVVILLGLTWIFAIFAIGQANVAFYYLFAVFNSMQGLFIFIFYCLLKKDAVMSWKRMLPCFEEYGEKSQSSSNSRDVTATRGAHHHQLVKLSSSSKTGSSTFLEKNAVSVASTLIDSRKNSYFSSANNNNPNDNSDTEIVASAAIYNQNSSPLLQQEQQDSPVSRVGRLSSCTSPEYNKQSMHHSSLSELSYTENNDNDDPAPSKNQNPSHSELQSLVSSDADCITATLSKDISFSKPAVISPSTSTDYDALQQESPENSHEKIDSSTILSSESKGEVDYSGQAKVREIIIKFEQPISETIDPFTTHL